MTMLAKWLRKASSLFAEKPKVKPDDFGMEHFLLYHGLAGSSPENQREFKDVRADILSAVSRGSSQNLCINLKLAPLWWEEKWRRIFDEAKASSLESTVNCLMPTTTSGQEARELDPLMHEDWRVRSNSALILSYLGIHNAQERMIQSLNDTAGGAGTSGDGDPNPAFCHVARALAGFRTAMARDAIAGHLTNAEPWIRVDAVNAIAKWPLTETADLLAGAFAEHHSFTDYASVALARSHSPLELLQHPDDKISDLAAAVLLGLFEAVRGPFSSSEELLPELSVHQCLQPLLSAAQSKPSAVKLRALHELTDWLAANYHQYRLEAEGYPEPEKTAAAAEAAEQMLAQFDINAAIKSALADNGAKSTPAAISSTARHAIKLAGEQQVKAAVPVLLELLDSHPLYRDELIDALGAIGDSSVATPLIKLANKIVNVEKRSELMLSANPVEEDRPTEARTYWHILKALGHLPTDEALAFLLTATQDHASDKREEALGSLLALARVETSSPRLAEVKQTLHKALNDPSAQVRIRALEGVDAVQDPTLVAPTAKLINAQEMSVSRSAFTALENLAEKGYKAEIATALAEVKSGLANTTKVKRIDDFIKHNL